MTRDGCNIRRQGTETSEYDDGGCGGGGDGGWTVVVEDTPARRDIRKIREKIIKKYKLNVVFTYSVKSPGRMYKKRA